MYVLLVSAAQPIPTQRLRPGFVRQDAGSVPGAERAPAVPPRRSDGRGHARAVHRRRIAAAGRWQEGPGGARVGYEEPGEPLRCAQEAG